MFFSSCSLGDFVLVRVPLYLCLTRFLLKNEHFGCVELSSDLRGMLWSETGGLTRVEIQRVVEFFRHAHAPNVVLAPAQTAPALPLFHL